MKIQPRSLSNHPVQDLCAYLCTAKWNQIPEHVLRAMPEDELRRHFALAVYENESLRHIQSLPAIFKNNRRKIDRIIKKWQQQTIANAQFDADCRYMNQSSRVLLYDSHNQDTFCHFFRPHPTVAAYKATFSKQYALPEDDCLLCPKRADVVERQWSQKRVQVKLLDSGPWYEAGNYWLQENQLVWFEYDVATMLWLREGLSGEHVTQMDADHNPVYFATSYTKQWLCLPRRALTEIH